MFLLPVMVSPLPALSADVQLKSDSDEATAGYFRLSWSAQNAAGNTSFNYRLQEASDAEFSASRLVYQGPDLARVISGKPDGDYYYRIRAFENDRPVSGWSDVTHVTVAHHSMARALSFFMAGAVVFFALLVFILTQQKKN